MTAKQQKNIAYTCRLLSITHTQILQLLGYLQMSLFTAWKFNLARPTLNHESYVTRPQRYKLVDDFISTL